MEWDKSRSVWKKVKNELGDPCCFGDSLEFRGVASKGLCEGVWNQRLLTPGKVSGTEVYHIGATGHGRQLQRDMLAQPQPCLQKPLLHILATNRKCKHKPVATTLIFCQIML